MLRSFNDQSALKPSNLEDVHTKVLIMSSAYSTTAGRTDVPDLAVEVGSPWPLGFPGDRVRCEFGPGHRETSEVPVLQVVLESKSSSHPLFGSLFRNHRYGRLRAGFDRISFCIRRVQAEV